MLAKYDSRLLNEWKRSMYSRDDKLFQIIDQLKDISQDILDNEGQAISDILKLDKFSEERTSLEAKLRERIFVAPDSDINFACVRLLAKELEDYRKAGRNFFRDLAEQSMTFYAKMAGIERNIGGFVEVKRFLTVVGYSEINGRYQEQSRALIPILTKLGDVEKSIDSFLANRLAKEGKAINPADLIYSHQDEVYDDDGYLLGPDSKKQKIVQVGESVMFLLKLTSSEKKKRTMNLVRLLMSDTIDEGRANKLSKGNLKNYINDLEKLIGIQERGYGSLYDALHAVVERTVTVKDLFNRANMVTYRGQTQLSEYLKVPKQFSCFVGKLEKLVARSDLIAPPIGYSSFGWKGNSLANKLLMATYFEEMRENKEKPLREFLAKRGLSGKKGKYTARDLRDVRRTTFLLWSNYIGPFTDNKDLPLRDEKGEEMALRLFGYHHSLSETQQNILASGTTAIPIKLSRFGLICNWKDSNNFDYELGENRRANGYGALKAMVHIPDSFAELNSKVDNLGGVAEMAYKTNVDDARSVLLREQSHAIYDQERAAIADYLIYVKEVISPVEFYAMQMFLSPTHEVM